MLNIWNKNQIQVQGSNSIISVTWNRLNCIIEIDLKILWGQPNKTFYLLGQINKLILKHEKTFIPFSIILFHNNLN